MEKCLAFVLGGGGARGAMQVGALRALIEAGFKPDLMVGTSIGAANAAALALWGIDNAGIEALEKAYHDMASMGLMESRRSRFILRTLTSRSNQQASHQLAKFFIGKGILPSLSFNDVKNLRLALVSSDLDSGQPVIFGLDPNQSILEGLLASIALPPWFSPIEKDGHSIMDGGAVSNLPIESAMKLGATEIIALDLSDAALILGSNSPFTQYLNKIVYAVTQRQFFLERALANLKDIPIHHIQLKSSPPVPIWDFSKYRELIQVGYEITRAKISELKN